MRSAVKSSASGFSLVELTVALVVTLIVSGAIYGLLAGGQSAFRREPEMADRQQNIRVAMDLIMRDIANAGSGLPPFVQVFTPGLDACSGCPSGGAPMGRNGIRTDELEMLTNDGNRDNEPLCADLPNGTANGANVRLVRNAIATTPPPPPPSGPAVIVFGDGTWTMRYITTAVNGGGLSAETNCSTTGTPTLLNFANGASDPTGMNPVPGASGACTANLGISATGTPAMGNAGTGVAGCPGTTFTGPGPCCMATTVNYAQVVRYRIRNSTAGVPELQRYDSTNAVAGFQSVARGIEDLQVQYTQANGTVTTAAPGAPVVGPLPPVAATWGTLITQVQVTLSSRSEAPNLQGATTDANLGTALRGSLTWTGSPRSALFALTLQSPAPSPAPWLWR
jgi:type II secretory pathway pseudopilin PulG